MCLEHREHFAPDPASNPGAIQQADQDGLYSFLQDGAGLSAVA